MKKVNLGIILIILTLAGMTFYVINEEDTKKKDVENINAFLQDYYKVYNKYSLLYEEDRDIDKVIDKSKYDKYKEEMKNDLDEYLIDDESLKNKIYDSYIKRIDEQLEGKYLYRKNEKTILEVSDERKIELELGELPVSIIYNNGYIFVTLKVQIDVDKTSRLREIYDKEKGKFVGDTKTQTGIDKIIEVLVLKKVNGKFKIAKHVMIDPIRFSFEEDMKAFFSSN